MIILTITLVLLLMVFDIYLKCKPKSKLKIVPIKYNLKSENNHNQIECFFEIINFSKDKETMISNLDFELDLFNKNNLLDFSYKKRIIINDGLTEEEVSNYWPTKIIKSKHSLKLKTIVSTNNELLGQDNCLWLKFKWDNYGHFGIKQRNDCFIISNHNKAIKNKKLIEINLDKEFQAIAIKTNMLGAFDDPVETICSYCGDVILENDILIIGETPLAIMQGRYILPNDLEISFSSKILCYFFHPTSSLATASGMQVLINKVGITRISFSLIIGFLFKLFRVKGMFYRLAGEESSLIDDISGTTVPYDKTIVFGPNKAEIVCRNISKILKIDVAVVDVNDLGRVKILATTNKRIKPILNSTLKNNPAGNDDQKTPIVLIRKKT